MTRWSSRSTTFRSVVRTPRPRTLLPGRLSITGARNETGGQRDDLNKSTLHAVPATPDSAATSSSSLPTMRNLSPRPWPSSPPASPSGTCSPRSSSSSNRPCPCWPWLPPPEGETDADRITLDPSTELVDAEGRTRARWIRGQMEAGRANERQEALAYGERHGHHRARRRGDDSILPSKKGEGGPSGPPPQRSTVQTH